MLYYGKLTGNIHDGCVEVIGLHSIVEMARPVHTFGLFVLPTEEWLQKYGNQFLAVLDYEQGKKERPLFLGITPLDNVSFPEQDNLRRTYLLTEKFSLTIADDNETLTIEQLNGDKQSVRIEAQKVVVKSNHIYLGDANASEPMVLGSKLKAIVSDIIDGILALTVPTGFGPSGTPLNAVTFTRIKARLDEFLSQIGKLK